jgi:hypothetical protein
MPLEGDRFSRRFLVSGFWFGTADYCSQIVRRAIIGKPAAAAKQVAESFAKVIELCAVKKGQ